MTADNPVVHRLDRGTSGLLVVARTPDAYESLVGQLSTHAVERTYTALVRGTPEHVHGVIDAPVGRSRRDPLRMTVAADGRPARMCWAAEPTDESPTSMRPPSSPATPRRFPTPARMQLRHHLPSRVSPFPSQRMGPERYPKVLNRNHFHRPTREFTPVPSNSGPPRHQGRRLPLQVPAMSLRPRAFTVPARSPKPRALCRIPTTVGTSRTMVLSTVRVPDRWSRRRTTIQSTCPGSTR